MSPSTASYGSWKSPITSTLLTTAGIGLSDAMFSAGHVYWLESRPVEAGRVAIVRSSSEGEATDAIPPGFNARSRVHEYGGGAYVVFRNTIFFSNFKDQRLYRQDPSGLPAPITPEPTAPAGLRYADLRVTPDGSAIVCVRERHVAGREAINEIVLLPADGSAEPVVIHSGYDFYAYPRLSPDGRMLAWLCWRHPGMPWDGTELWVANFDSGVISDARRVAGGISESVTQPEWSPEGVLHFVSDRTGWWNLYVERKGEIIALAPLEAEFGLPQWIFGYSRYAFLRSDRIACVYSQNGLDYLGILDVRGRRLDPVETPYTTFGNIVSDGIDHLYFTAASATNPVEAVALDVDSKSFNVLRRSLQVEIDPAYISEPEAIEFPTAKGKAAFALFYRPKNKDFAGPGHERPPLLVISHGGPTSATSSALKLSIQYWTSRGFAIVDVNYGGSTGYGREYRERLRGQWGVVDVEDCINAARYLERQGAVDGKRMAIRGGSAGGYTTLCALAFHKVFAAGASYFGVADIVALLKDTHKFESHYEEGLIGPYPEAADLFYQRSPINFCDRISCPVILFQGLEDKVVPPSQAELMIGALRAKNLPFAYIAFPTEGHGFREAENIKKSVEAELYFYSRVFDFTPSDHLDPVTIEGSSPAS